MPSPAFVGHECKRKAPSDTIKRYPVFNYCKPVVENFEALTGQCFRAFLPPV